MYQPNVSLQIININFCIFLYSISASSASIDGISTIQTLPLFSVANVSIIIFQPLLVAPNNEFFGCFDMI